MSSYVHIGQDYSSQTGSTPHISSGNPGFSGDGVHWPYDPNGNTPDPSQFHINWNDPNAMQEAEQAYERLINWLRQNPGCYNGYIMLLQMTTDIGQHLGSLPQNQQEQLVKFLSNQLSSNGKSILSEIIAMAAQGAAVSQSSEGQGEASATNFLQALAQATSALAGFGPPFSTIYYSATTEEQGIANWCQQHYKTFTDPASGVTTSTWVDDNGVPITSFSSFANMAAFTVGMFVNQSNVQSTIDAYYQAEIQQLVDEFKGNPWALLVALMNLINQRDQDDGTSVNGYGNNLDILKQANTLVQRLLGDISSNPPNAADFFKTLQQLKTLVEQDPALSQLVTQLESDIGTVSGQKVTFTKDMYWNVKAGYYQFPPGTLVYFNGQQVTVPPNGIVYVGESGTFTIPAGPFSSSVTFTFAQLAAMGDTDDIQSNMGSWSSTVMSNFENSVTGIQTLLNGASPAIQQQIQNVTQTMQARENFEKEAFDSITNINQQIMKLVQQVMG